MNEREDGAAMSTAIVVGVDGSAEAERALAWAIEMAAAERCPLQIVYCADLAAVALPDHDAALANGRALLADAEATAFESTAQIDVRTAMRTGDASAALLEQSAGALMLVVGMHGAGRIPDVLLGSVSYRVAGHADCPVMLVGEHHRPPDDFTAATIAIGLSGSSSGRQALEFALARAENWGKRVIAVRAVEGNDDAVTVTGWFETPARNHPTVDVNVELPDGPAVEALRDAAARADVLVVGTERGSVHRLMRIGPVAGAMVHRPPCPVVIVGPENAARSPSDD
jgi:nucleotide-binding universal stress UspA family protein